MSLFKNLRRSIGKSRLMKRAARDFKSGRADVAIREILEYLSADPQFAHVVAHFSATREDIETIAWEFMAGGMGDTPNGHFVPVSALLFPDTLAYLLRAERGQVEKALARQQVYEYFLHDAIQFEPERQFHQ